MFTSMYTKCWTENICSMTQFSIDDTILKHDNSLMVIVSSRWFISSPLMISILCIFSAWHFNLLQMSCYHICHTKRSDKFVAPVVQTIYNAQWREYRYLDSKRIDILMTAPRCEIIITDKLSLVICPLIIPWMWFVCFSLRQMLFILY